MSFFSPSIETLRPQVFAEVEGVPHLISENGLLTKSIQKRVPFSLLFYGPSGCGKTTILRIYGKSFDLDFLEVDSGSSAIAEIKKALEERKKTPLFSSKKLIVFVDEFHRLNKLQQDFFLPLVESSEIILLAATSHPPTYFINHALLSRLKVFTLPALSHSLMEKVLDRILKKESSLKLSKEQKEFFVHFSSGDARKLLHLIETTSLMGDDLNNHSDVLSKPIACYDKNGSEHYLLASALQKSIRGSDVDAALYYLFRMLEAKEDIEFIFRRLLVIASEDIGLADPSTITHTKSCIETYKILGEKEGVFSITQCVIYLCLAPKSNSCYVAAKKAKELAESFPSSQIPSFLHPNKQISQDCYEYAHDFPDGITGQEFLPADLKSKKIYEPKNLGFERELKKRVEYLKKTKKNLRDFTS